MIARICEEFNCLPTAAVREWRRAPDGLVLQVMEAKAFASTWRLFNSAKNRDELPPSPMLDLVIQIEMEGEAEELREQMRANEEGGAGG